MNNSSHQSPLLKQKEIDILREAAAKAEKDGKLTKAQANTLHEHNWFKTLVPSSYGGSPLPLPELLQLEEALSGADGSAGWVTTLCANAGWFSGFMDQAAAKKLFSDNKACVAHSSEGKGVAEKTNDGYKVSGKWNFVVGATDASAFVGSCTVTESGASQNMYFLILKDEITVTQDWNAMGLSAAAAHTVEVKDVTVPADRAFKTNEKPAVNHAMYQVPFTQLMEATLGASVSGMTLHFIDLCEAIFAEKHGDGNSDVYNASIVRDTTDKYTRKFHDARTKLYYAIEMAWQTSTNNQVLKPASLYKISAAASELAARARECADALYPFCGIQAADKSSEINRVWRDIHTACLHPLLVFGGME